MEAKVNKLDKIDSIASTVNSIDERLGKLETRMSAIENSVTNQQGRLDAVESGLQEIKDEYAAYKELNADTINAEDKERIQLLEESNKAFSSELQQLKAKHLQLAHACEVVIGGIPYHDGIDPKTAAFTVIKTILPEAVEDAVRDARVLISQAALSQAIFAATQDTGPPSDASTSTANGSATLNNATGSHTRPKVVSIGVTLKDSLTTKNVIAAKAKWKKLTTSQLNKDLVISAGLSLPSEPTAININHYMSKEQYQLKCLAYRKSKIKALKFVTFVRDGCIYVRRKNEETSTVICSPQDLDSFLENRSSSDAAG